MVGEGMDSSPENDKSLNPSTVASCFAEVLEELAFGNRGGHDRQSGKQMELAQHFGGIFDGTLDDGLLYTLGELMNVSYLVASEKLLKCVARPTF